MEIRDLYDGERKLTGETIVKGEKVPQGRYYLTVMVFMENSKGELLLQKRSKIKGSKYATTGGHPKTGETSLSGIQTEIEEELGIKIEDSRLKLFKTVKTEDDFVDVYYYKGDIDLDKLVFQEEEVEFAKYFSLAEIDDLIKDNKFLEAHIEYLDYYKEFKNNKN